MKFGSGVDYSLKALLMLAERYPVSQPLRLDAIATAQNIPRNYLRVLLIALKHGSVIISHDHPRLSRGSSFLSVRRAHLPAANHLKVYTATFWPNSIRGE